MCLVKTGIQLCFRYSLKRAATCLCVSSEPYDAHWFYVNYRTEETDENKTDCTT